MREIVTVRLAEDWATRALGPNVGKQSPLERIHPPWLPRDILTRRVTVATSDPLFTHLKKLIKKSESDGKRICGAVTVSRHYTANELARASLYRLIPNRLVEESGMEHGTKYERKDACPKCGYGIHQLGDLVLPLEKLDCKCDFVVTLDGNELLVRERLVQSFIESNVVGCEFRNIVDAAKREVSDDWKQLIVNYECGLSDSSTRYGIDLLHDDPTGRFQCSVHHYSGLRLLSELTIKRWDSAYDIGLTTNRVGVLEEYTRPNPLILVSKRVYELLTRSHAKGLSYEVAYQRDSDA